MVILKSLKKQLNQFVTPEFETLVEDAAALVRTKTKQKLPAQNAYSHGLENIYALENIDPSTIRTLGSSEQEVKTSIAKEKNTKKVYSVPANRQFELNLGPQYSSSMPSFVLNQPLNILKVSDKALESAKQRGLRYLKDLVQCDWNGLILQKGLGQGHAEELQNALKSQIGDQELFYCQTVDYKALMRSILSEESLIKHYHHFRQYGLEEIIELTPIMHLELKRASEEVKARWLEESLSVLKMVDSIELLRSSLEIVIKTFVIPWLYERKGFAFVYEILDRLEQISEDPCAFDRTIHFLSSTFCNKQSVVLWIMPTHDENLVFVDEYARQRFLEVEEKALSYFYKPDLTYSVEELALWVLREMATSWKEIDRSSVEKVITHSPLFQISKSQKCQQVVYLA